MLTLRKKHEIILISEQRVAEHLIHSVNSCQRAKLNLDNLILQSMRIKVYVSELVPVATLNVLRYSLVTSDGKDLVWVVTVRYLGVYVTRSKRFSCSFDNAKRSFYRRFNSVFGKIGRLASEEVV